MISEDLKREIDQLVEDLNYYTDCYDAGRPEISDEEWDDMYFDLIELEKKTGYINPESPTQKIHYETISELKKVKHNHPMLSLAKTKDENDIKNFINNEPYVCMAKMDGLTCSLTYQNGRLLRAETRGDGEEGEDITHNARVILSIPKKIFYKGKLVVDGEIICDYKTFEKFKNEYKNPRNFASGAIRRLDSKECEKTNLTFVAWDIISSLGDDILINENKVDEELHLKLVYLADLGFKTVPSYTTKKAENFESLKDQIVEFCKILNYPIDGIVVKYNDVEYYNSLGSTAHHFNGGIAFKFYDEEYETELVDIEWGMSRTGTLTPVAIFKPVDIDGTTVTRANLSNVSVMKETLGDYPELYQPIWVTKRNQIIPKVERATKNDIPHDHTLPNGQPPLFCPICGGDVKVISTSGNVLVAKCMNPACKGKLSNQIDHYCDRAKGLDIRGLSTKTIEQLIEWGWLTSIKDLYTLDSHLDEWIKKPGFGEKSVLKILDGIKKSKTCRLDSYISALGIPLIGLTVAKEIVKYFPTWEAFRMAGVGMDWTQFHGFGYEMSRAINSFDYTEADFIAKELDFIVPEEKEEIPTVEGMIFVITGKLSKTRDEIKKNIENHGGKVTSSVSSKTNYLVCNDKNSTTGKSADAKKLGIPVITEEELNKLLGD